MKNLNISFSKIGTRIFVILFSCFIMLTMCFSRVSAGVTNSSVTNLQTIRYAVVLNDSLAVLGAGHQALILVDNYGNGEYFSFGPENENWYSKAYCSGRIDYGLYSNTDLNTVLKSHNFLGYRLTNNNKSKHSQWYNCTPIYERYNYIVIPVTASQGNQMLSKAKEYINNIPKYNLAGFQCDNFVSSIMSAGGRGYWVGNNPNISFINISNSWGHSIYGMYSSTYWQAPKAEEGETNSGQTTGSTKSYTVTSTSGLKVRTGAGTGYSQVGGVANGSVIKYTESASANGYTWIKIASGSSLKSGTWGSTTGYWVAMVNGSSSSGSSSTVSQKSYTITSSSGVKVRNGAGTGCSQVGGIAKGSVVKYTETKSANGYTWVKVASGSIFSSGTWGSTTGYWVAIV